MFTCPQPSCWIVQFWEGEGPRHEREAERMRDEEDEDENEAAMFREAVEPLHGSFVGE